MIVLWAILGIAPRSRRAGVGPLPPGLTRYVAIMTLPLAPTRSGPRSDRRCSWAALRPFEDYWIEPRLFGINGLVKTVLGWALGGSARGSI